MDSSWLNSYGNAVETSLKILIALLAVAVPLAIWKVIDIVSWIVGNVHLSIVVK